ncbi:MAG: choice-of-anchor J domain-containing protein, partial [Gammaproteobacteria bacterium]|nr:choice-of-anchor J domain-containing protein [Gammaproteobacteria bacterium]
MKKRGHIKLWILVGILLSFIEPFNSFALSANISNPSFEEDRPDTTWTCDGSGISCWKGIATGWMLNGSVDTWHPNPDDPVSGYPNGLPDGENVVAINPSGSVEQTLEEVLSEGYTYSLEVNVGHRPDVGSIQYAVQLYAGDSLLGYDNGSQIPDAGEFLTITVNYTAQPGDPSAGQPLSIRLANTGSANQVNFDLVSLDVSPTTLELSPIDNQAVEAGGLLSVPVTATDSDGQPIALSVVGLPPFATFTDYGDGTGLIEFSPDVDVAPYYYLNVIAQAGNQMVSDVFRLTVGSTDGSVILKESFEVYGSGWSVDNGVWEVGVPTSGPASAHSGSSVAATVLDGDYPAQTDSRLISPVLALPTLGSAEEGIELRFWHWFDYDGGDQRDKGYVQVSVWDGSNWGAWTTLATPVDAHEGAANAYRTYNSGWSRGAVDLTAYAGQQVRLAFYHVAGQVNAWDPSRSGWYLDEVELWRGNPQMPVIEGFE